jgi:hypothetical protein
VAAARACLDSGRTAEAFLYLRGAENSATHRGEVRRLLGLAHLRAGDLEQAVDELMSAGRACPEDAELAATLEEALERLIEPAAAVAPEEAVPARSLEVIDASACGLDVDVDGAVDPASTPLSDTAGAEPAASNPAPVVAELPGASFRPTKEPWTVLLRGRPGRPESPRRTIARKAGLWSAAVAAALVLAMGAANAYRSVRNPAALPRPAPAPAVRGETPADTVTAPPREESPHGGQAATITLSNPGVDSVAKQLVSATTVRIETF